MRAGICLTVGYTLLGAVALCGCARTAYIRYSYGTHTYRTFPGRPLVAITPFADERWDKVNFGTFSDYELKTGVNVGKALREELAKTLQIFEYNVTLLENEAASGETAPVMLKTGSADMILSGTIINLWASAPDAALFPAEIGGHALVSFATRSEPSGHQRDIQVTDRTPVDVVGLKHAADNLALQLGTTHSHPGLDELFQKTLARLALGIVEDAEIQKATSGLRGKPQTLADRKVRASED